MMHITIVMFADMEDLQRNVIYVGHVLDVLAKIKSETIDCILFSPPYLGCRSYTRKDEVRIVFPVIWGGNPACQHEWSIITPVRKATPGDVPGPESKQASRRTSAENRPFEDSEFCAQCGAWRGDLGNEPTVKMYVEHIIMVCRECVKILKPWGTLWINVGDTYAGSGGSGGRWAEGKKASEGKFKPREQDYPDGSVMLIPQRLEIALADDLGLVLPNVVTWHKPNAGMHPDYLRFGNSTEHVIYCAKPAAKPYFYVNKRSMKSQVSKPLGCKGAEDMDWKWNKHVPCNGKGCKSCAKSGRPGWKKHTLWKPYDHYFNQMLEPLKCPDVKGGHKFGGNKAGNYNNPTLTGNEWDATKKEGRNIRDFWDWVDDTWEMATSKFSGGHYACWPPKLAARILDAACPRQICSKCGLPRTRLGKKWSDCGCGAPWMVGIAIDPFVGAGSDWIGIRDERDYNKEKIAVDLVGIEINPDYAKMAKDRVENMYLEPGQSQLQVEKS